MSESTPIAYRWNDKGVVRVLAPEDIEIVCPGTSGSQDRAAQSGVWVAYYSDWSALAVFATEVEALRHAVEHSMNAQFFPWGDVR